MQLRPTRASGRGSSYLGPGGLEYSAAGTLLAVHYANGASTATTPDERLRPKRIVVEGLDLDAPTTPVEFWSSGDYQYDGAGNITAIGGQEFGYDRHGRLTHAKVAAQAQGLLGFWKVDYTFDIYGNMTDRTWTNDGGGGSAEQAFVFANRQHAGNRVAAPAFAYDANGNMTRFESSVYVPHAGARWTEQNRMHTFTAGDDDTIVESYFYDADGYRIVRRSHKDGPHVSFRDGAGQLVAEFKRRPGVLAPPYQLTLERDYVEGAGQVLVEREVDFTGPDLGAYAPLGIEIQPGFSTAEYVADLRTSDTLLSQWSGTVPADGRIPPLLESDLAPGETNYIRVKALGGSSEAYTNPVTVAIDPTVGPGTPNQVRSLTVARMGATIEVLAALYQDNGRTTTLYFQGPDDPAPLPITNFADVPAPGMLVFVLDDTSIQAPCGQFTTTQDDGAGGQTAFSLFVDHAAVQYSQLFATNQSCESDEPTPGYPYPIADTYHHRDHLGSLRVVTDPLGFKVRGRDYYPFGTEIAPGGIVTAGGSKRRYTGHERDEATELGYMFARFCGSSLARFLSVDPGSDHEQRHPQSWNYFIYTRNNPLRYIDPDGKRIEISTQGSQQSVRRILVATLQRASGRAALERLANRTDFVVTFNDSRIQHSGEVDAAKSGSELTFGRTDLTTATNYETKESRNVGADVHLDTYAIQAKHSDGSGVTTAGHEIYHAEDFAQGLSPEEVKKKGDSRTSATGEAAKFGNLIYSESTTLTKKQARKLLNDLLRRGGAATP